MKYTLAHIAGLGYRWGDCQAIPYDAARTDVFPSPSGSFLLDLYELARTSGRARLGIIEPTFCGMRDISAESIVSYLHSVKLVILGEWRPTTLAPRFHPLGFCFLSSMTTGKTSSSGFGAYAFFEEAWRTPQQTVLTFLGISALFASNNLASLHGIRYSDNKLTARWMAKFGFRDLATVPNSIIRSSTGELTESVVSTLSREDFEQRLSAVLELGEQAQAEEV